MGTVRKIGDDYFIEFMARGLKYQQKAGPDEQAAWKMLADVEEKIRQGEMGILDREIRLPGFMDDFMTECLPDHTPRTKARFEAVLQHFNRFLSESFPALEMVSELTPKVFEDYKSFCGRSTDKTGNPFKAHTINLSLILLGEVMEFARKTGVLNDNPTLHIRRMERTPPGWLMTFSPDNVEALFLDDDPRMRAIGEVALQTGMMLHEIVAFQWEHVLWEERSLLIPAGRSGQPWADRRIPLSARLIEVLESLRPSPANGAVFKDDAGHPLTVAGLKEMYQKQLCRCQINPQLKFSVYRHTFVKDLLERGVTLFKLYRYLGLS